MGAGARSFQSSPPHSLNPSYIIFISKVLQTVYYILASLCDFDKTAYTPRFSPSAHTITVVLTYAKWTATNNASFTMPLFVLARTSTSILVPPAPSKIEPTPATKLPFTSSLKLLSNASSYTPYLSSNFIAVLLARDSRALVTPPTTLSSLPAATCPCFEKT